MKKSILLLAFIVSACISKNEPSINTSIINGHWEIVKVETPNDKNKTYNINTFVDFFKLNTNNKGFRQKLKVDFSGNYSGNNIQENITIHKEKKDYIITYKTSLSTWTEKILKLTDKELILQHNNGINYHYKKHDKLNIK